MTIPKKAVEQPAVPTEAELGVLRVLWDRGASTVREVFDAVTVVFAHYETWLGLLAAAAMIFAAIRIRRFRDDS